MFTVSKEAVAELKRSMAHHDFDDMPLRVAAQKAADGAIEYQMGFDEAGPGDAMFGCNGIDVVIANDHKVLLNGTKLDFVEMEDGQMNFIFLNPNDPTYVAPAEEKVPDASGPAAAAKDASSPGAASSANAASATNTSSAKTTPPDSSGDAN